MKNVHHYHLKVIHDKKNKLVKFDRTLEKGAICYIWDENDFIIQIKNL